MEPLQVVQVGEGIGNDWPRDEAGLLHGICEDTIPWDIQGPRINGAHTFQVIRRKIRAKFEHGEQIGNALIPCSEHMYYMVCIPFIDFVLSGGDLKDSMLIARDGKSPI